MQKQVPTAGRLLTMVLFALSCFGLLLFLWLSFGGSIPLQPKGYRIKAAFPEAVQLGIEADVRESGVTIGKVVDKTIDRAHRNRTIATMQIDPKFAPIPSDAKAILRQKTLLGETYIEISPGTPQAPKVKENGSLADSRVAHTVQLDELLNAFDPQTRRAFQVWQQDLAVAVNHRGQDLNDSFGNLPQFAADANDLLGVLDSQSGAVQRLVKNTGVVFDALSQDQQQLHNLITGASNTFAATSSQEEALAQTFQIFPTFLDESKKTFARLESFSKDADPVVRELQPAIHDLAPTLQDAQRLAPDLRSFFTNLDPLITASQKGLPALTSTLDATKPLLGELQPFLQQLNPIFQWLEYYQRDTADFISNGAGGLEDTVPTATSDEVGHYLRQFGPTGAETAGMYANRPAASRGNAYLSPLALSGVQHDQWMIFPNHDCSNTGEPGNGDYKTPVPDTNAMPSCFVQTPPSWPPGNTLQYPHIGPADYSK